MHRDASSCDAALRLKRLCRAVAVVITLSFALQGCSNLAGNACPDPMSHPYDPALPPPCDGSFLSPDNQRAALYAASVKPRLATGSIDPVDTPINTSSISPAAGARPADAVVAYAGSLRMEVPLNDEATQSDIADIRRMGARRFAPDERVEIRFERATVDAVLRQLLSGALGLEYIAPNDLGGAISFRTEQRVPKSQVLQIVRDLLGREGLVMKQVNGVYHIGRPELIAAMEGNAAAGRSPERVARVVRLRRGNASEVLGIVRQLVPEDVTVVGANTPDALIVRGTPTEVERVQEMINSLAARGLGDDRIAIIQLRNTQPERMATILGEFAKARRVAAEDLTVVPLEKQQSLLVGTRDRSLMAGVRSLIRSADVDRSDEATLRLVPLKFLNADDIVPQLNQIFGQAGAGGGGAAASRRGSEGGLQAGVGRDGARPQVNRGTPFPTTVRGPTTAPLQTDPEDGELPVNPPPAVGQFSFGDRFGERGRFGPGAASAIASGGPAQSGPAYTGSVQSGAPQQVRIVADARNNTVMVFSNMPTFRRVREVLASLDRPQAQVVIEATVLEVQVNDSLQYGVQAYLQGKGFSLRSSVDPTPVDNGRPGGRAAVGTAIGDLRVDVVVQALQEVTNVKVISSPYLTVVDGKQARLVIGDQIPFATRAQSSNNLGNVTVTEEIETRDTGVVLDVTPRVFPNNSVALNVNQSVSRPSQSAFSGDRTPIISTRAITSNIMLQSGRTILLAGMIQERLDQSETGVPVLRRIPILGELFKSSEDRVGRQELLVLITPRVVRQGWQMDEIVEVLRRNTSPR
jgi:general secretion pathway protein D